MTILMRSPINGWLFVEFFPKFERFIDAFPPQSVGFYVFRTLAVNFMKASLSARARYLFILFSFAARTAKPKQNIMRGPISVGVVVLAKRRPFREELRAARCGGERSFRFGLSHLLSSPLPSPHPELAL